MRKFGIREFQANAMRPFVEKIASTEGIAAWGPVLGIRRYAAQVKWGAASMISPTSLLPTISPCGSSFGLPT